MKNIEELSIELEYYYVYHPDILVSLEKMPNAVNV